MAKKEPENIDMDLVAEQELSRLQRQYRIMEGDRFAYSGETNGKLKRQKKLIGILKKEQANVEADLTIAMSESKRKQDEIVCKQLDNLLHEHDTFADEVKTEKSHLTELDFQIKKMHREIAEIKKRAMSDAVCQARIIEGERRVAMLENKLEVAVKKFNVVVSENYELRNKIDHLLKERAHFNNLWDQLISSLNEGKKFMLDLIEQATLAYDQRDEWCSKLQALRTRGNHDLVKHTKQMRFLQRKLDHDAKLQEFLGKKGQRRILADLEEREAKKRKQAKENMEKKIAQYKDTLQKIQRFCGESDIERLVAKFIKQEEENFALFNYVNELNHESEALSYAIEDLKKNIDEQRDLNNKRETQQKSTIENLEKRLEEETTEADRTKIRLETFDKDLEKTLKSIETVFNLIKCNNEPILELLGDNTTINPYNVMMYLGLIEKRTTELLQMVYYKEKTTERPKMKGRKIPPIMQPDFITRYKRNKLEKLVPTQPCPLCVEQEQVSDIIDTLQLAQTPAQVVEKLAIRLELPHALDRLHNVSACHLPQSRKIIQQRYQ